MDEFDLSDADAILAAAARGETLPPLAWYELEILGTASIGCPLLSRGF